MRAKTTSMTALLRHRDETVAGLHPISAPPKPDEVRLRVSLAGICRTDIYAAQGKLVVNPPLVLGHEFCATVDAVGASVSHLTSGQRVGVMPIWQEAGASVMLGLHRDGAFAEYVTLPARQAYAVPEHLSDHEVAYLEPVAACLAVLQTGIAPTMRGHISGDNRIAELLRRILSTHGFLHLHGDAPYDFIIETEATSASLAWAVEHLHHSGILVLKSRYSEQISIPFHAIVEKELRLVGAYYAPFQDAIDCLASGNITVSDLFGETYSLQDALAILSGQTPADESRKHFLRLC